MILDKRLPLILVITFTDPVLLIKPFSRQRLLDGQRLIRYCGY